MVVNWSPRDESLALKLEEYMRGYKPISSDKPVEEVHTPPPVMVGDAVLLRQFHEEGCLREKLQESPKKTGLRTYVFMGAIPHYFQAAILDFFEQGHAENIKYE